MELYSSIQKRFNLVDMGDHLRGPCPIHGGNNPTSFVIYNNGYWQCYSRGCHEKFGCHVSVLNKLLDTNFEFKTDNTYNRLKLEQSCEPPVFEEVTKIETRIPSQYFISRGYSDWVLRKFKVGDIKNRAAAAVPIYNSDILVGYSNRTHHEKCLGCGKHHITGMRCSKVKTYSKWTHTKGLKTGQLLYNLAGAAEYIKQCSTAVVVESMGNVWRLEETGIKNTVAIMGTKLSAWQAIQLRTFCSNIVLALDNDPAGCAATEKIAKQLQDWFVVDTIGPVPHIDWGDISVIRIREIFNKKGLQRCIF